MITIKAKGLDKVVRAFNRAPMKLKNNLSKGMGMTGAFMMGKTKEHINKGTRMWKSPVDTGQMRQGLSFTSGPLSTTIRTSARTPYAGYVHDGTSRMRARPFFQITAEVEKDNLEKFISNIFKDII